MKRKKMPIWEQEASLFSNAKKREGQKGYNLNTAGLIRSLHNFLKSAPIEPATKRDRRGNIHLNFIGTAHRWIDELHKDCNYEDVAGAYSDWRQDHRSFICEKDILDNNYPDYQVLGGKVGAKKQTKRELDKEAKEVIIGDLKTDWEAYENERWKDIESGKSDIYDNLNLNNNINFDKKYNKEYLNYWKNQLVNNLNNSKEQIERHKKLLETKLKKSQKEESLATISIAENSINNTKILLPKIYYLKDKILFDYDDLEEIINTNYYNLNNQNLKKLKELNKKREFLKFDKLDDYIKLIQYDYEIHNILEMDVF